MAGAAPRIPLGDFTTLSRTVIGWGGDSILTPYPLNAFGISLSAPATFRHAMLTLLSSFTP